MVHDVKKISDVCFVVEKSGSMNVPLKIFASQILLDKMIEDNCIQQGINVASLPGIKGFSLMMPDSHQGYGFSIGGVAAFDAEKGCISPGGIGYDINCGVRLLVTNLKKEQVSERLESLLNVLFKHVPPGVGGKSLFRLNDAELDDVMVNGPKWAVDKGLGFKEDLELCESNGSMPGALPGEVSPRARTRGKSQLGTLGSGNHFLEIQYVDEIFLKEEAEVMGLKKGMVVVLIHSGSRGLGHQVCSDYIRDMEDAYKDSLQLVDKSLIYAPIDSDLGKKYFGAMACAANFAWTNRHLIAHQTRKSFVEVFGDKVKLDTVYDVAHNIAKFEEHVVDGKKVRVLVHRKGATRAFPKGHSEVPSKYRDIGQPIFIPGSMGTSSYVLVGSGNAMVESFGSTAHGAGRVLSRHAAIQLWEGNALKQELKDNNILVKVSSVKGLSEEAPGAYKDVDEVVRVSHEAGIGKIVARLKPLGVIKG